MQFRLTLTAVLAFLVPGSIALGSVMVGFAGGGFWEQALTRIMTLPGLIAVFAASFVLGTLIDALRTILLNPVTMRLSGRTMPKNYLESLSSENLQVLAYLVERTEDYYRLNANSSLAFVVLTIASLARYCFSWITGIAVLGFVLLFVGAVKARKDTLWAMDQFAKKGS